jgi:predicted RNase H-like nuclease
MAFVQTRTSSAGQMPPPTGTESAAVRVPAPSAPTASHSDDYQGEDAAGTHRSRASGALRRAECRITRLRVPDAPRLCDSAHVLVVGVDGCRAGWIAVAFGGGKDPTAHYLPAIHALQPLASRADGVAIDIPIGLPTRGHRDADLLARDFVGPRRHSVFLTPVRDALEAGTHALATQAAVARTGTGISQQAHALGRKILEVERWLPSSPCPVWEVHPEVSFAVLLGAPAQASKKTWAGMVERRNALEAAGISLDGIGVDSAAAARASVDDVLDATVAAWSAARIVRGAARSFPDSLQLDVSGKQVAIWA